MCYTNKCSFIFVQDKDPDFTVRVINTDEDIDGNNGNGNNDDEMGEEHALDEK